MYSSKTSERKLDHINICLQEDVEHIALSSGFEEVFFIHNAAPELSIDELSLTSRMLGRSFSYPLAIAAMTGGHPAAEKINRALAEVAESLHIPLFLGSQRAALERSDLADTYRIARKAAPSAFIVANLGASQIVGEDGVKLAERAVDMVEADALAVHLNLLHEAVQPEGDPHYKGVLEAISKLVENLEVPVIAKETGAGISKEVASALLDAGVSAIDVGGAGGTSWAAVEYYRSQRSGDFFYARLGKSFWDWGIPTAVSICEVRSAVPDGFPVIATGGVRSGIDVAKALALGANMAGMALPLLRAYFRGGKKAVLDELSCVIEELKVAMLLAGAKSASSLSEVPLLVVGFTAMWLKARGTLRENVKIPW